MANKEKPEILEVSEVKMFNPDTDETNPIKRGDFEGISDIYNDPRVEELRDEGWFTRGITAKIEYKNRVYEATVSGNTKLGYVKISNIEDIDYGRELQEKLRRAFLKHFRIYPEVNGIY